MRLNNIDLIAVAARLYQMSHLTRTPWCRPKDDRLTLSALLFVLRTGLPWRDLSECYGPQSSVYARYRRWCASGLFAQMLAVLAKDAEGELRQLLAHQVPSAWRQSAERSGDTGDRTHQGWVGYQTVRRCRSTRPCGGAQPRAQPAA